MTTFPRVLSAALVSLFLISTVSAQSLSDVILSLSDRQRVVSQGKQVLIYLRNENNEPTETDQPIPDDNPIDWLGVGKNPTQSAVDGLDLGGKIALLNQAVAVFEVISHSYLNSSLEEIHSGEIVGSLKTFNSGSFNMLPRATTANYQELLRQLSKHIRSLRLISWPSCFQIKTVIDQTDVHEKVVYDDPGDTNHDGNNLPRIELHDTGDNVVDSIAWKPDSIGPGNLEIEVTDNSAVTSCYFSKISAVGEYGEDPSGEEGIASILRSQKIQLENNYPKNVKVCATAPTSTGLQITGDVYVLRRSFWNEFDLSDVSLPYEKNEAGYVIEGSSSGGAVTVFQNTPTGTFKGAWITTSEAWGGWYHELEQGFALKGYQHAGDGKLGKSYESNWKVGCKFFSIFEPDFTRGVDAAGMETKFVAADHVHVNSMADGALQLHPRPSLLFGIDLGPGLNGSTNGYISTKAMESCLWTRYNSDFGDYVNNGGYWKQPIYGGFEYEEDQVGYHGRMDSITRFDSSYTLQLAGSCSDYHVVYENDRSKRIQKLPTDGIGRPPTSTDSDYDTRNLYSAWDRPRLKQVVGRDLVADIVYTADHFGGYTVNIYRRPAGSVQPIPRKAVEVSGMTMIRTWAFSHTGGSNAHPTDREKLEVSGNRDEKYEIQANHVLPGPLGYSDGWYLVRDSWWWLARGERSWTLKFSQGSTEKIKEEISILNNADYGDEALDITLRNFLDGQLVTTVKSKTLNPFTNHFPQDWVLTTAGKTITASAVRGNDTDGATRYGRLPTSVSIKYGGIQPDEDYTWDSKGLLSSYVGGSRSTIGSIEAGAYKKTHKLNGSPVSIDWTEFLDGGRKIKTYSAPDGAVGGKSDSSVAWSEVEYGTATNGLPGLPLSVKNSDGSGATYDWNPNQGGAYTLTLKQGKLSGSAVSGGSKVVHDINERGQPNKIEFSAISGGDLKTSATTFSNATAWGMPKTGTDYNTGLASTWNYADNLSRLSNHTSILGVASSFSGYDVLGRPETVSTNGISAANTYNVFSTSSTITGAVTGSQSQTRDNLGRLTSSNVSWNGVNESLSITPDATPVGFASQTFLGNYNSTLRKDDGTLAASSGPTLPFGGTQGTSLTVEDGLLKSTTKLASQTASYQTTWTDAWGRIRKIAAPTPSGTGTTEYLYSDATSSIKRVCITDPTGRKTISESDPYNSAGSITRSGIDMDGNGNLSATDRYVESTVSVSSSKLVTVLKLNEDNGLREILRTEWNPNGNQTITRINGTEETLTRTPNYSAKTVTTTSTKGWTKTESFNNLGLTTNSNLSGAGVPAASLTPAWRADGSLSGVTFTSGGNTHSATFNSNGTLASLNAPGKGNILGTHTIGGGSETLTVDGVTTVTKLDGTQTRTNGSDVIGKTETLAISGGGFRQTTHPSLGADTTLDFHASGAATAKSYAAGNGENYSYTNGLLSKISLARGGDLTLGYTSDGAKDPTTATWPALTSGNFNFPAITQSYGYDRAGRVKSIADSSGTRLLAYQNGRSSEVAWTSGVLSGYKIAKNLDTSGRNTGFSLNRGNGLIHAAIKASNGASSEISGISSGTFAATFGRDPVTRSLTSIIRGPVIQNWTRDTSGRITAATSSVSGAPSFAYTSFDTSGRRKNSITAGGAWTYQYTNGQLTSAVHPTLGSFIYAFDGIGRRTDKGSANTSDLLNRTLAWTNNQNKALKVTAAPTASVWVGIGTALPTQIPNFAGNYSYPVPSPGAAGGWVAWNTLAVLTGQGDAGAAPDAKAELAGSVWIPPVNESFSYDAAGNRQSTARWDLGWDGKNQLVRARTKDHAAAPQGCDITQAYDAEGRRFSKKVNRWLNGQIVEQRNTTFVHDGNDLIYECYPLPGGLTLLERKYVWGPDISGTQGGAGGAGGLLLIRETIGNVTTDLYPTYDGSGNVVALADSTGILQAEYAYGPFGELIYARGPKATSCPFRFATKYYDQETGFYNFGKRFYDPITGQFLCREPIGEKESLNLYSYCGNDPINYVDVDGLWRINTQEAANDQRVEWLLMQLSAGSGLLTAPLDDWKLYFPESGDFGLYKPYGPEDYKRAQTFVQNLGRPSIHAMTSEQAQAASQPSFGPAPAWIPSTTTALTLGAANTPFNASINSDWLLPTGAGTAGAKFVFGGMKAMLPVLAASVRTEARILTLEIQMEEMASGLGAKVTTQATTSSTLAKYWPENSGFLNHFNQTHLMPGTQIDRYGFPGGKFVSPTGTSFKARALPNEYLMTKPYHLYEVLKPIEVNSGRIMPWFNQSGMGIQHELPVSIDVLLKRGFLKELGQ